MAVHFEGEGAKKYYKYFLWQKIMSSLQHNCKLINT